MLEDQAANLTPIAKLGEFGLIERITAKLDGANSDVLKGIGDDAAVYRIAEGEVEVVSTDLLVEGIHFDLAYVPLQHLGFKAVAVNVSDILAMNASPFAITVSIAVSSRYTVEALETLYEGIQLACDHYNVDVIGGDTSSSRSGMVISVTAIGKAKESEVVYRSGAGVNDLVCVTGDLGAAYAGLQVMEREKQVWLNNPEMQPDLEPYDYVVGRQLRPEARQDIIKALRRGAILPSAMIDVSDGLASDFIHLCHASNLGGAIFQDKIPVDHMTHDVAGEFNLSGTTYALNGGEDYELLFTMPLMYHDTIKLLNDVFVIGYMTEKEEGIRVQDRSGQVYDLEAHGWNHFQEEEEEPES